jgi:O-antigen/teichoic acid export membrane protein
MPAKQVSVGVSGAASLWLRLPGSAGVRLALFDQAVVSASNFATTVILVQAMGLAGFGTFSLLWLVPTFAVSLQQALLGQPMLTFVPKQAAGQRGAYLAAVLRLELTFSLLVALATCASYGFFLAHWDREAVRGTLLPMVLVVTAKQAHAFVRASFFATQRRDRALCNDLLAYPGQVLGIVGLWTLGALTLSSALWVIGLCSGTAVVIGLLSFEGRAERPCALGEVADRHWQFSKWTSAMTIAQWFASNSYVVAAGALLGSATVGALKAAHTVIGVLHLVLLSMENVVPVTAAAILARDGREGMSRYLVRVTGAGLLGTASISAILALFPGHVLGFIYRGEVTGDLVFALRGLALLYLFGFLITVLQIGFRTLERTRVVFVTYMVNTLAALLLAEPVVSAFGFKGAVLGMAGQQALLAALLGVAWWSGAKNVKRSPI